MFQFEKIKHPDGDEGKFRYKILTYLILKSSSFVFRIGVKFAFS